MLRIFQLTFLEQAIGWLRTFFDKMYLFDTAKVHSDDPWTYAVKCAFCEQYCFFDFWLMPYSFDEDHQTRSYKPHNCNPGLIVKVSQILPNWCMGNVLKYKQYVSTLPWHLSLVILTKFKPFDPILDMELLLPIALLLGYQAKRFP